MKPKPLSYLVILRISGVPKIACLVGKKNMEHFQGLIPELHPYYVAPHLRRMYGIFTYPKNHWTLQTAGVWPCITEGSFGSPVSHQLCLIPWFLGYIFHLKCMVHVGYMSCSLHTFGAYGGPPTFDRPRYCWYSWTTSRRKVVKKRFTKRSQKFQVPSNPFILLMERIWRSPVQGKVVFVPIIYKVLYILGGAGLLPSTVWNELEIPIFNAP